MAKLIAFLMLFTVSCEQKENHYCSDAGFRYIKHGIMSMAPDFNKLGLPMRCGKNDR